jgi:hypothetical protein
LSRRSFTAAAGDPGEGSSEQLAASSEVIVNRMAVRAFLVSDGMREEFIVSGVVRVRKP